jgi:integrase/recombinase XerD
MSIRQKNNGRFVIDYYPNGRRGKRERLTLPETITEREDAQAIERDLRKISVDTQHQVDRAVVRTVADLWPHYRSWYEMHRAARTYEDVRQVFDNSIIKILGHVELTNFESNHHTVYARIRKNQGVCNRTINKELSYLSGCFTWARKRKYKAPNITPEELPHARPLPIVLTVDETHRFIESAEPFFRALFLCLYGIGLRKTEATLLRYENIDRNARLVRVTQKGGKHKIKSIPPLILEAIDKLRPWQENGLIFESWRNPGEPIKELRDAIARAQAKAGISKHIYPHLLRHSFATHLMADNVNLRTIQKQLGHSAVGTTEWYTHVTVGDIREATDNLMQDYIKRKTEAESDYKKPKKRRK